VRVAVLVIVLVLTGCGTPTELPKQADEVGSIAAEGSLLAHDAAEGSTTGVFTREHAKALRKLLGKTRPAIEDERLGRLAERTDALLARLASEAGDERAAGRVEHELASLAEAAGSLAG
jgi:hypothetical protein